MNAVERALTKIFGSANERLLKKLWPIVFEINAFEPEIKRLSDEQFQLKTAEFGNGSRPDSKAPLSSARRPQAAGTGSAGRIAAGSVRVRARSFGTLDRMRHFDVQMIGGMVLHRGMIAEMRTGEGKTLVATLPVYLNALLGKGVHVVTVNDYLAHRDAEWMGKIYKFLGMTVGMHSERHGRFRTAGSLRAATSPTGLTTNSASITCATT